MDNYLYYIPSGLIGIFIDISLDSDGELLFNLGKIDPIIRNKFIGEILLRIHHKEYQNLLKVAEFIGYDIYKLFYKILKFVVKEYDFSDINFFI